MDCDCSWCTLNKIAEKKHEEGKTTIMVSHNTGISIYSLPKEIDFWKLDYKEKENYFVVWMYAIAYCDKYNTP